MQAQATIPRIDAHQHFWRYQPENYAWINDDMPVLRRDFLPKDLAPLLKEHRLDGSIAVQARMHTDETDDLLALARDNASLLGVVGWIDLRAPDCEAVLERQAECPMLKGYRHQVQDEPSPADFLADSAFNRGVEAVLRRGKVYEVLIHAKDLDAAATFCARHEGTLVLDHLGKPDIRHKRAADWGKRLKPLAAIPHVSCKLSGLITEAQWNRWTPAELLPYCEAALEAFGPSRLMFGSDWPVCLLSGSYGDVCSLVEQALSGLSESEQRAVWGGNAYTTYHLSLERAVARNRHV